MVKTSKIKPLYFLVALLFVLKTHGQDLYYGNGPVTWENNVAPEKARIDSNSNLVILNQSVEFTPKTLSNYSRFLICNENGAHELGRRQFPESFDRAYDEDIYKQGRRSAATTPFIEEYSLKKLAARKFSKNKWTPVKLHHKVETIRRVRRGPDSPGRFIDDQFYLFELEGLQAGDIVDLYYEATYISPYGSNVFYLNSRYPKLKCFYQFSYEVDKAFENADFFILVNTDYPVTKKITPSKENVRVSQAVFADSLAAIAYPSHSFGGKKLPYIFIDFKFYRRVKESYPTDGGRIVDTERMRPEKFKWMFIKDTTNYYTKVYDKQSAAVRKFLSKMPPILGKDSSSVDFFKALCDTFNNFRFITSNQMYYNEPNLMDVYSGDHLLKRRLVEHLLWKLYGDLLNEGNVFYYLVNIQDRRLGEHSPFYRTNYSYERNLVAIPTKNSYIYFMPRYNGLKYHLNELPFYFEGSLANLSPRNFQASDTAKDSRFFKFIKTHKGTFNENTRTENGTVKVSTDSLQLDLFIKESLSGQFSTTLRHYYLNEYIDSTVSPYYFKKCTDKPSAMSQKIKLSSKITEFPFRYSFACNEKIKLKSASKIDLTGWFSFLLSKVEVPEAPQHEYFFDFDHSDAYNYLFEFSQPVEIINRSSFQKNIHNDYFDLTSEIVPNNGRSYLLKVQFVVKKLSIPLDQMALLMEVINELDELNKFKLELKEN